MSDEEIAKSIRSMLRDRDRLKWSIGDGLTELERRHPIENKGGKNDQWVNDFCLSIGMHHQQRKELIAVCLFYPPTTRHRPLTFEHFRDAMFGAGPTRPDAHKNTQLFLDISVQQSLTVSQLRKHIRETTRVHAIQESRSNLASYSVVFSFRRFATAQMAAKAELTKERARLILADLGTDVLDFIGTLQRIAAS